MKGSADRVLCYITLYIQECINILTKCPTKTDGSKRLYTYALENFSIPGDNNFALSGFVQPPKIERNKVKFSMFFYLS